MLGICACYFTACRFFKFTFLKKSLSRMPLECQTVSKQINLKVFVSPDLDPNCLQNKTVISSERVKYGTYPKIMNSWRFEIEPDQTFIPTSIWAST